MGQKLKIKIFADGANVEEMKRVYAEGIVTGFTTNPTLMRKAGVGDYLEFARAVLQEIKDLPVSFETLSDDTLEMEREARLLSALGNNVYVKIPVINTKGISSTSLIEKLSKDGVKINVTAVLSLEQAEGAWQALNKGIGGVISIFAGRIADTGIDPTPIVQKMVEKTKTSPNIEILWASPREVYNIVQADACGCHIITVTNDLIKKMKLFGKNLDDLSRETVQMFYNDAKSSKFVL